MHINVVKDENTDGKDRCQFEDNSDLWEEEKEIR